ncbi:MAG: hypothetical protein MZW92_21405 [Comamonadaceae bacterium]|nr:hypothetical protein [Comamonadaceae bacterium]
MTRHMDVVVANYSGTGRSAYTDDTLSSMTKYLLITRLYGCSLLDPVLAACRWDFRSRARRHFGDRVAGGPALRRSVRGSLAAGEDREEAGARCGVR